jgi:indolepyruvate ferredoxin oxidoreductase beta subunit
MNALAKEAGTVVSAVMLGAIAGSGLFPFRREDYEAVVQAGGKGAEASLRGFAGAYEIVAQRQQQAAYVAEVLQADPLGSRPRGNDGKVIPAHAGIQGGRVIPAQAGIQGLPQPVAEIASLGYARLVDYQDKAYAELYAQRLQQVLAAEREADPAAARRFAVTKEMARWLALWMAFDDVVRVADLKSRAARWARVQGEVKAGAEDLLKVYDHFKPGVPEFAALLPEGLARRLQAWGRRRVARGQQPWALPLKIGTHSVAGMAALRTLAAMKRLRPRGSRFALEQGMIEQWLQGVVQGTQRAWELGHEIALCGRLIKGYGTTNERGKENLLHVLEHLARGGVAADAAKAIRAAREAALADDAGKALDATLAQHGAPPRPVKAVPVRWVRKPRGLAEAEERARAH